MKKIFLAVCLIASVSITLVSCDLSSSKHSTPTIIGNWKVDSVYPSGKNTSNTVILMAVAAGGRMGDSTYMKFNTDSTFTAAIFGKILSNKYYVKDKQLFLREEEEDSNYHAYILAFPKDSIATLTDKDSLVYVLKKK